MPISMKETHILMDSLYKFSTKQEIYTYGTASDTKVYVPSYGANYAIIHAWGGGGSGGTRSGAGNAGGGGGGAGFFTIMNLNGYPSSSIFMKITQIGGGGSAPTENTSGSGGSGSATIFDFVGADQGNISTHKISCGGGFGGAHSPLDSGALGGLGGVFSVYNNKTGIYVDYSELDPIPTNQNFQLTKFFHGGSGALITSKNNNSTGQAGASYMGAPGGGSSTSEGIDALASGSFVSGARYEYSSTIFGAGGSGWTGYTLAAMKPYVAGSPGAIIITYI